jgi:hypothetical protein
MSFLQRLKNRGVRAGQSSLQSDSDETAVDKVAQLDVDVYQTEDSIIVYAQAAGAGVFRNSERELTFPQIFTAIFHENRMPMTSCVSHCCTELCANTDL